MQLVKTDGGCRSKIYQIAKLFSYTKGVSEGYENMNQCLLKKGSKAEKNIQT